jgi:hypothetical protein
MALTYRSEKKKIVRNQIDLLSMIRPYHTAIINARNKETFIGDEEWR